jgi:hypothetical protein
VNDYASSHNHTLKDLAKFLYNSKISHTHKKYGDGGKGKDLLSSLLTELLVPTLLFTEIQR